MPWRLRQLLILCLAPELPKGGAAQQLLQPGRRFSLLGPTQAYAC